MTSDGISLEDWATVRELAVALANASDDEDEPHRERLLAYLRELISKYGELPSIVATQADYAGDPGESERLLLRAFDLALPIDDRSNVLEIALSLADLYASDLQRVVEATRWLEIASAHIDPEDETDRTQYKDIEETIERLKE